MNRLSRMLQGPRVSGIAHDLRVTPYRCRECQEAVRLLDNFCPHCAAAAPVRLPTSTIYLTLGMVLQAVLLCLR